jgi:hypothetical protein
LEEANIDTGEEEPELPAVAPGNLRVQQSPSDSLSNQQIVAAGQQQEQA